MTARHIATVLLIATASVGAAACGHREPPAAAEPPTLDVTSWTGKTELFMEYPPLVVGQSARLAVHLTTLADFKALNAGKPSIVLMPAAGGSAVTWPGTPPLRPGAFRVEGTPAIPGKYTWALLVEAPGLSDRHDLGEVTVFADAASAIADAEKQPAGDPTAVSYLKEPQWTNPFATALTTERELRTSLRAPASVEPLAGGDAIVAAPAAGRFASVALPRVGSFVSAGQTLGALEPRMNAGTEDRATLAADVAQAESALEGARAELTRAERLLAERAVPARRVEDARRAVTTGEARVRAAEARLAQREQTLRAGGGTASGNTFTLRAPIAGRVTEVRATPGASYDEGAPLFRVVRTDRVELKVQVPAPDAAVARAVGDIEFEIPGRSDPIPLKPQHMHDSGTIDPSTSALPVLFEVVNPRGQLLIGHAGTAVLYRAERVRVPAVPKAAVLMEAGRPYVWVQEGGESFLRKYIEIAARDGDWVGIRSGIKAGDRVVTQGAYEVQLAAASRGLPAEGHVH
jgi:cobalt-zinc-cadmium efflux system membrane fusion protein